MPNLFKEKLHFESFTSELFGSPIAEYERGESPDFIFERFDKTIGVEHTQIFLEGSKDLKLIAIESIGNDIARRVQGKGRELQFSFQATLLLNLSESINSNEREYLANETCNCIVNEVKNRDLSGLQSFEVRPDNKKIKCIRFVATNEILTTRVSVSRAGWVKRTIDQEVIAAISSKKSKANNYTSKCHEIWLLIVADGHDPSSLFDDQPPILNVNHESPFQKVYYLNYFDKRLTEIVTTNG